MDSNNPHMHGSKILVKLSWSLALFVVMPITLFICRRSTGIMVLIVYVDDIVLSGSDSAGMRVVKDFLKTKFEIKDLGPLRYFLGIEVARSSSRLVLSQRKYALDLLMETGMLGCKPATTLIDTSQKVRPDDGALLTDPEMYRRLVGRLIYLTITRPNLSFAVGVVSQFMQAPHTSHLTTVYRILRYLKSAPGLGLRFQLHSHLHLSGYSDADCAGSTFDCRSTSGFCTFLGGNLITWKSKKQPVVAQSSAEAEYRAMAHATCELVWLRNLLEELGYPPSGPIPLHCDNQAAIHIARNPVFHERTKHIEVDCHFIREKVASKEIVTPFVRSGDQLADVLTKSLSRDALHRVRDKLGMINIYAPT
ncbi:uncharacterized mitochondrial protein AtMg00810-like [Magnolia sinica]|uniref:uncharacterized mitochondrial protein AtMg00810-like n=1 Tax=Magnolia sinica TaxID=86752 RepID=UPI0026582AA9|nr:uncharacterized mitochondrial protein AtMg00810-like [Magnolia sinica]